MDELNKRVYSVSGLFRDIFKLLKSPGLAVGVLWGNSLPPRFRERLSLAVISVTRCRFCAHHHTREALQCGLSQDDVNHLLGGVFEKAPLDEAKALLYARHWTEQNGRPDSRAQAELFEIYGEKKSRAIEMMLLLVRIGSLSGNTIEYFLHRLSGGRWGGSKAEYN